MYPQLLIQMPNNETYTLAEARFRDMDAGYERLTIATRFLCIKIIDSNVKTFGTRNTCLRFIHTKQKGNFFMLVIFSLMLSLSFCMNGLFCIFLSAISESQCPITPSHKQCITYQRFSGYRILVCIDWLILEG